MGGNAQTFGECLTFDADGRPLNPVGRTGLAGRGLLGKWGSNHAADPIVTRFHPAGGQLQVVAIQRKDTGQWAIPGGMVVRVRPHDAPSPLCMCSRASRVPFSSLSLSLHRAHASPCVLPARWRGWQDPGEAVSVTVKREFKEEAVGRA